MNTITMSNQPENNSNIVNSEPTIASGSSLSQTKFHPPLSTSLYLERPRLLEMIKSSGHAAKLVLITGPAGFGKTTLMKRAYDACQDSGRSWLTLNKADNDDARFMSYLLSSLGSQHKSSTNSETSQVYRAVNSHGESITQLLDCIGKLPKGYTIFLDDFDTIHANSVLEIIRLILSALNPDTRLIIGTRTVPDVPLGRLRAHGQLLVIDTDSLRFTPDETLVFFQQQETNSQIDKLMINRLQETTEGWIASLQLVALTLKNCNDTSGVIRDFSGSHHELADYLAEDLLANQPVPIRDFLLKSSILNTMNAHVCNSICGIDDSANMLVKLEHDNLFISAIDNERVLYRYHKLFRSFLRHQLNFYHPGLKSELHKKAAHWYAANKFLGASVKHALLSEDMELAGELINNNMESYLYDGHLTTIIGWFKALPERVLERYPRMLVYYAWCLVWTFSSQKQIRTTLDKLNDPILLKKLDPFTRSEAMIVSPMHKYFQDDFDGALKSCEDNLSQQQCMTPFSIGVSQNIKAMCLLKFNRFDEASNSAELGREAHNLAGSIYGQIYSDIFLGLAEYYTGHLQSALTMLHDAWELAMCEKSYRTSALSSASAYLVDLLYCANKIDDAKSLLDEFLPLINYVCLPDQALLAYLIKARIDYQEGGYTKASKTLNAMRHLGQKYNYGRMVGASWGEQARIMLIQDDVQAAERYLSLAIASVNYNAYNRELWFPIKMGILIKHKNTAEAQVHINREIQEAEKKQKMLYVISLKILLCECLQQNKELKNSSRELSKAVSLASKEGIIRPFIDASPGIHTQLQELRATSPKNIPADFFEQIYSTVQSLKPEMDDEDAYLEKLTHREFDVLRLLAMGKSNQAICDSLYLSLATVKTHLRNINDKLHAKNRTEAVAIARRRHLVE